MNDRFRLTERTRVVALDASLLDEATLLAGELSRNLSWKIPAESSQRVNPGDIVLGFDASLKPEAYRLRVTGTRALLAGGTKAGVFHGTRTLLQLFPRTIRGGEAGGARGMVRRLRRDRRPADDALAHPGRGRGVLP